MKGKSILFALVIAALLLSAMPAPMASAGFSSEVVVPFNVQAGVLIVELPDNMTCVNVTINPGETVNRSIPISYETTVNANISGIAISFEDPENGVLPEEETVGDCDGKECSIEDLGGDNRFGKGELDNLVEITWEFEGEIIGSGLNTMTLFEGVEIFPGTGIKIVNVTIIWEEEVGVPYNIFDSAAMGDGLIVSVKFSGKQVT